MTTHSMARVLLTSLFLLTACTVDEAPEDSPADPDNEELAQSSQEVKTYGSWGLYGSGQCVTGARTFYQKKYSVTLSATGVQGGNIGSCLYLGACMYWVSSKVRPSSSQWIRYEWGSTMPQTYDLVIYPPKPGTSGYGHVASVDHMEGTDKNAYGKLYIMDSNFNGDEKKASAIHTFNRKPYGFYRLKSLVKTCDASCDGNSIVNTKCEKTSCGTAKCVDDSLGPRCVEAPCPAKGDTKLCDKDDSVVTCHNGDITKRDKCDAKGESCSTKGGAHCDTSPVGYLDEASCTTVKGWTHDPGDPKKTTDAHLYYNGPSGADGATKVVLTADLERSDLCSAIGSCNHGFEMPTPRSLLDGKAHPVHAYGIDLTGGANAQLSSSPRSLSCPPLSLDPDALLRRLDSEATLGAWHFSAFQDVAPYLPASGPPTPPADAFGPALPDAPKFVHVDGSADVWLLDSGVRRLVPGSDAVGAWHASTSEVVTAGELAKIPEGLALPAQPELMSDGTITWLIDRPFLPDTGGEKAGSGGQSGGASSGGASSGGAGKATSGAGGKAGGGQGASGGAAGSKPGQDAGAAGKATGGKNGGQMTVIEDSPSTSEGSCAQASGPARAGAWLSLGAALLGLSRRRRRA